MKNSYFAHNKIKVILAVFTFSVVGLLLTFWYIQNSDDFDRLRKLKTSYTIYAPVNLDKPLVFSPTSVLYSQGVLFYDVTSEGKSISVSQQAAPNKKIPMELPKTKELQVDAGRTIISRFNNDRVVVSITNQQSIITLNIPFQISDAMLVSLLESFQAVN